MAKQRSAASSSPDMIPDKLYFRIGEVASLCGVETYVLRFWQTEFPQLRPNKSGTGQRLYRRRDVEMALRIKQLLHNDGYTLAGARQIFAAEAQQARPSLRPQGEQARSQSELPLASSPASDVADGASAEARQNQAADRAQVRLARMRLELQELLGILSRTPGGGDAPGWKPQGKAHSAQKKSSSLFDEEPR